MFLEADGAPAAATSDRLGEALVEELAATHNYNGRALAASLINQSTRSLTAAEKNTLVAQFEKYREHASTINTRAQFSAFALQYNNLKAGLPAELRPNDTTVAAHWRTAVSRGSIERARQLDLAIGLAVLFMSKGQRLGIFQAN